ncbi:nitrous oxide reductase accessory protein NosL [Thermodesulfobacteriota bacterium]
MKIENLCHVGLIRTVTFVFFLAFALIVCCVTSGTSTAEQSSGSGTVQAAAVQPMVIAEGVSCGKCGMYPAKYPRWQSQIIFKDGSMTPFDGCKCMFNFMNALNHSEKSHTGDDVAAVFVRDFNTGKWVNGPDAHFVVGSSVMGPMGMELIPFADKAEAMRFHHENGGQMKMYSEITQEVLKPLMGGMKGHHDSTKEHGHDPGHDSGHGSGHMKM